MEVKVAWLESEQTHIVKLKKYEDSFECALCDEKGLVYSPTRYKCNIRPDKLAWKIKQLDKPIIVKYPKGQVEKKEYPYMRDRVSKLNLTEWAIKYGEQNTLKEIYTYLGVRQHEFNVILEADELNIFYREEMEKFMEGKEVITLDPEDTRKRVKKFLDNTGKPLRWFLKNARVSSTHIGILLEEGEIYPAAEGRIVKALEKYEQEAGY